VRERLDGLADREAVNACFRELHSIKGAAGSFGIEAVAMTAHEAEDIFARLREESRAPTTPEQVRIKVLLGTVGEELDEFEDLVLRLKDTLSRLEAQDSGGERRSELEEFVASIAPMVGQLERSLVKPMELVADIRTESIPHLKEMRTVIIHLIRNAADHGLEDEYERLFQGKPKRGRITLTIRPKDEGRGAFVVEVGDDGQGLNFDRIAERGEAMGLIQAGAARPDKDKLLSLLFRPGFSTKDKVDEISGRGVGLDLVRDIVKSLGGSISVGSARGQGTKFAVTIPA
jgi:chemotaxis protein histidine kinase CheA